MMDHEVTSGRHGKAWHKRDSLKIGWQRALPVGQLMMPQGQYYMERAVAKCGEAGAQHGGSESIFYSFRHRRVTPYNQMTGLSAGSRVTIPGYRLGELCHSTVQLLKNHEGHLRGPSPHTGHQRKIATSTHRSFYRLQMKATEYLINRPGPLWNSFWLFFPPDEPAALGRHLPWLNGLSRLSR